MKRSFAREMISSHERCEEGEVCMEIREANRARSFARELISSHERYELRAEKNLNVRLL